METSLTTSKQSSALDALKLLEAGALSSCRAVLEGCSDGAVRTLVEGGLTALRSPEKAKDKLSEAARSLDGELRDKALIWLSCCYWATGERQEARITLGAVKPATRGVEFLWGLTKSALEMEKPKEALARLRKIEKLADDVSLFWRGKFCNQRATALWKRKKIDAAFISFEEAKYCFEQVEEQSFLGIACNNIAACYLEARRFPEAHESVARALGILKDNELAQSLDLQSQIYLAEGNHREASRSIEKSLSILEGTEHQEFLVHSIITKAKIQADQGLAFQAFKLLERATEIAEHLNNKDLMVSVFLGTKDCAERLAKVADISAIRLALELEKGSFRSAAKRLNVTHPTLTKFIKRYALDRKPARPKPLIPKTLKK